MKWMVSWIIILLGTISFIPLGSCISHINLESTMFMDLLKLAPEDTLSNGEIILINYDRIWEDSDVSFYKEDGSKMNREEIIDVRLSLPFTIPGDRAFSFSSYYSGMNTIENISSIQTDNLGYNWAVDVHAEIRQGYIDDNFNMVAMIGDFSTQATRDALQNQDGWPDWAIEGFTTESYLDIPVYSWGGNSDEHFSDAYSPPHLDDKGIAKPLAAMDGYMLIGTIADNVKRMISSAKGKSPSLADVQEYTLIVERMDYLGAYAVMLSESLNKIDTDELFLPLGQHLAAGYGDANDEQGNYTAVVAVYENEDLAQTSAGILEEALKKVAIMWNDGSEFADVRCDGRILTAKIYINKNTRGYRWNYLVMTHGRP